VSCGVQRRIPVRWDQYGSRGVCIGTSRVALQVCPWERRAGLLAGAWRPRAAAQAPWVVAHVTPTEGAALVDLVGHLTPSTSPLERLPQALHGPWEAPRPRLAATLRHQEARPPAAVTMAVSRDGVRAPRQDGPCHATRPQARAQGQAPSGPAGSQEVGDAPVSDYARQGARLGTRRMAHLKPPLTAAVRGAWSQRPAWHVVNVAAGASDHGR